MKKDNSKFWCKFCRVFVYDNKISRNNHDKQAAHKSNVERFIREIESKKAQELKQSNMAKQLLGIPVTERVSTNTSSLYIPTAADTTKDEYSTHTTAFKEIKSSIGQVGEWETIETSNTIETQEMADTSELAKSQESHAQEPHAQSNVDQVKDKILQFSRSVLQQEDKQVLSVKSAAVDAKSVDGKGDFAIKKRVFKGNLKNKKI